MSKPPKKDLRFMARWMRQMASTAMDQRSDCPHDVDDYTNPRIDGQDNGPEGFALPTVVFS